MTDDSIFSDDNTTNTETETFLDQLVGEGKKFKDAEALARGKAESDRYVDQLRTELENQKKLNDEKFNELLSAVKNKGTHTATGDNTQTPPNSETNSRPSDNSDNTNPNDAAGDIESLVKKALKEQQDLTTKEANLNAVDQRLTEMFGDKAASVVDERSKELGLSKAQLKEMASTSPKAFMKLIAGEETKTTNFPNRVNSASMESSNNRSINEQGWSYYKKLKKENPSQFWKRFHEISEKVQKVGPDKFYNS